MKKSLSILVLVFISSNVFGNQQISKDSLINCLTGDYIKSYAKDAQGLVLSPVKWTKEEWITTGTILTATSVLFVFDKQIADFSQTKRNKTLDDINTYFFDPYGKMYYTVPLMGAFYIYGLTSKKSKPQAVALDFVKASVYSGIIITGIKHLAHRHRPYQTIPHNPYLWDGPITSDLSHTSFASGHTIMAWTFASVLATHYKEYPWVSATVYSIAAMEGLARIYADKHWSTDVVIGASLGFAIGKWVVNNNKYCNLAITPSFGENYSGFAFNVKFGN